MSVFNTIKLTSLNQINEIKVDDFLIVENENGTNLIKLPFFLLKENNVSFYTAFETVSGATGTLANSITTQLSSLSALIFNSTNNYTNSFSATVVNEYSKLFSSFGVLTIPAQQTRSNVVTITTSSVTLSVFDVVLTVGSKPSLINIPNTWNIPISGDLIVFSVLSGKGPGLYDLQARIPNVCLSAVKVNYRIIKPY